MCTGRGAEVPGTFSETGEKAGMGLGDSEGVQRKGLPSHHHHPRPPGKIRRNVWPFPQTWRGFNGSLWPSLGTVLITTINYQ